MEQANNNDPSKIFAEAMARVMAGSNSLHSPKTKSHATSVASDIVDVVPKEQVSTSVSAKTPNGRASLSSHTGDTIALVIPRPQGSKRFATKGETPSFRKSSNNHSFLKGLTMSTNSVGHSSPSKTSAVIQVVVGSICMVLFLTGVQWFSKMRDDQDLARRNAEVGIRITEANAKKLEDESAVLHAKAMQAIAAAKASVQQPTAIIQPVVASYDCNTKASNDNAFRNQKLHELVEGQSLTATGCMWAITSKSVQSVSGNGYSLEVPFNETTSYKCPSAQVIDCASFLNEHKGKNFRVLVNPDGNVTIN